MHSGLARPRVGGGGVEKLCSFSLFSEEMQLREQSWQHHHQEQIRLRWPVKNEFIWVVHGQGARIMDRYIMQVLPWPRTVILGCVGGHLHAGIISDGASGVGHHEWGGGPAATNP